MALLVYQQNLEKIRIKSFNEEFFAKMELTVSSVNRGGSLRYRAKNLTGHSPFSSLRN